MSWRRVLAKEACHSRTAELFKYELDHWNDRNDRQPVFNRWETVDLLAKGEVADLEHLAVANAYAGEIDFVIFIARGAIDEQVVAEAVFQKLKQAAEQVDVSVQDVRSMMA